MADFITNRLQNSTRISIARPSDLGFVVHLQKKFSNQLGFLPRPALEWYINNNRVLLARENDQAAGYILGRESMRYDRSIAPITQAAVCLDLQRSSVGRILVEEWSRLSNQLGRSIVQAWCRADIEARHFWHAMLFEEIVWRTTDAARGEPMILFRRKLQPVDAAKFYQTPPVAGHKARKVRSESTTFDVRPTAVRDSIQRTAVSELIDQLTAVSPPSTIAPTAVIGGVTIIDPATLIV